MRCVTLSIALLAVTTGCTSHQLRRSTVGQASTVTDLQYQQVLNNLAMFYANPAAIPFHVTLHDGSAQISDFGNGFVNFNILDSNKLFNAMPGISGSRTVVEQWSLQPVTDDTTLNLLRVAYHKAYGRDDDIGTDFSNDLANELKKQIAVTEDLKNSSRVFYDMQMEGALRSHFEHNKLAIGEQLKQLSEASKKEREKKEPDRTKLDQLDAKFADAIDRVTTISRAPPSPAARGATYGTFDAATQTTSDVGCSICDTEEAECIELLICGNHQCRRCPTDPLAGCACSRLPPVAVECEKCKDDGTCPAGFYDLENPLYVRAGATIKWSVPGCDEHCGKKESQKCPPESTDPEPVYVIEPCSCDDQPCKDTMQPDTNKLPSCDNCCGSEPQPEPFWFQAMVTKCIPGSVTFSSPSGPEGIGYRICRVTYTNDKSACGKLTRCTVPICRGRVIVFGTLRSPLTVEVCRQVREVKQDINNIKTGWFSVGPCKPKTHCLVGEYCYCGCKYYAWVNEGGQEELSKFTLTVLKFGALVKDAQVIGIAGGVKFFPSPGVSR